MTAFQTALRLIARLAAHPTTQKLAKHALRVATAEVIRYVQRETRGRKTPLHFS